MLWPVRIQAQPPWRGEHPLRGLYSPMDPRSNCASGSTVEHVGSNNDVWEMDDEDALEKCDFRRATELQVAIQRADVEVTGEAGQTRYFSCSIGQHCRDGQVLTVEWVNATAAPTPAQEKDNTDGATQRAFAVGFMMTYFVVDIFF